MCHDVIGEPLIHKVFNVTDSINVAQYFMASSLTRYFKALELNVSIVFCVVYHIVIQFCEVGLVPRETLHVDEAIKVVDAECYFNAVSWCNLYFVLCEARESVRNMYPCFSH